MEGLSSSGRSRHLILTPRPNFVLDLVLQNIAVGGRLRHSASVDPGREHLCLRLIIVFVTTQDPVQSGRVPKIVPLGLLEGLSE